MQLSSTNTLQLLLTPLSGFHLAGNISDIIMALNSQRILISHCVLFSTLPPAAVSYRPFRNIGAFQPGIVRVSLSMSGSYNIYLLQVSNSLALLRIQY